jgi:hypothetical protein
MHSIWPFRSRNIAGSVAGLIVALPASRHASGANSTIDGYPVRIAVTRPARKRDAPMATKGHLVFPVVVILLIVVQPVEVVA